jgi:hypothetical protein
MTQEEFNRLLKEREVAVSLYNESRNKINNRLSIFDINRKVIINSQLETIMNRVRIEIKLIIAYDKARKKKFKTTIGSRRMSEFRNIAKFEKENPGIIEVKLNDIISEDEYPIFADVLRIVNIKKPINEIVIFKPKTKRIDELNFLELQDRLMKNAGGASVYLRKIILMMKKDHMLALRNDIGAVLAFWLRSLNEINKIYPLTKEVSDKENWFRNSGIKGEYTTNQETDDA